MDKAEERLYHLASHNYSHHEKNNYNDKLSNEAQQRLRSHGIGLIFDPLKNLNGDFLHTEPFDIVEYILCSICSVHTSFERLDV